jgi:peptidoglycan/xylan/chitin deacetylase (PgdA/CDA1 family)
MVGIWPNDIQCVVDLSIDLEGRTPWIQRNPDFAKLPGLMSMGDFGPKVGARRLLDLLDRYGIQATFSAPAVIAEAHPDQIKDIHSRGHELINHGYVHEPPTSMTPEQEADTLDRSRLILEKLTGEAPLGYKSPSLSPSETTLNLLAQRGYLYDSSLMDDDTPYVIETDHNPIVEIPVSWEWNDFPYFAYVPAADIRSPMQTLDGVLHTWKMGFEGTYQFGGCFTLLLHPQIIGRPGRLLMLENLIQHIQSFHGVAFMKGVDIARVLLD